MKRFTIIIMAMAAIMMPCISKAQTSTETNSLFYHSIRVPQNNQDNPALFPASTKVYVTLPGVGLSFGSPLSISNMLTPTDTVTYIDFNKICDQLTENNKLRTDLSIDILGFGFKIGNSFFDGSVRLHNNISFGIPIDAINFLRQGNVDKNGDPINRVDILDGDLFNAQSYTEIAVGGGHKFDDLGLTVGAKAKMLFGIASINTNNTHVDLETSSNLDDMTINAYYQLNSAGIVKFDTAFKPIFTDGFMPKSNGLSFDLGASYKLGPVTLSASIIDLSRGINWKQNATQITPKGGTSSFSFSGVDFNDLFGDNGFTLDSLTNLYADKIDSLNFEMGDGTGYWHSIPTKVNLGASISFLKICRAGILLHGQWDRGLITSKKAIDYESQKFRYNATLSASINLKNWLEVTVANGFISDAEGFSILNPGIGLTASIGTAFQVYIMADYVSSIYLVEAQSFHFMTGINLLFGSRKSVL